MKKKRIIIGVVIVLAAVILLTPIRHYYRDGGSRVYKAITYTVYTYHKSNGTPPYMTEEEMIAAGLEPFLTGTRVEVLGIKVYDDYNDRYSENGEIYLKR